MKLKGITKSIKSFGFKLLPNIVQQFFVWKNELKNESYDDISTEFDKFLSTHLERQYRKVYGIVNTETNSIIIYKNKLCLFSTLEKATDYYVDKGIILHPEYRICTVDMNVNITQIFKGFNHV